MYDFDSVSDRRLTYSSKWQVGDGELPLTTADMDFQTAPEILGALRERLNRGVFGYTDIPDAWAEAYRAWWRRRHGIDLQTDWLVYSTGVVATLSSAVRKLTTPGEKVVLLTPVYNIFFNCIVNNGRVPLEVPLKVTREGCGIDFAALEAALADPQVGLMFLCNPHNPTGRIWSRDELKTIGEMSVKHGVVVIADEIHCDLTDPGCSYVPYALVSENCAMNSITCIAPTKTFNLAGMQTSAVYAKNPVLRHRIWREINTSECGEPNAFAIDATLAAFTMGETWLNAMLAYVAENKRVIRDFITKNIPDIYVLPSEATYLLWMDCRALSADSEQLSDFIRRETGLLLTPGEVYGKGGAGWLRMNAAYPRAQLDDGLARLAEAVRRWRVT